MNGSLKFKDMVMLLNYFCTEQSVKILVQSLTNCKSYGDLYDGVSAFTEHVENHFATFLWRGGGGGVECFVCILFIRAVMVMNIVI